MKQAVVLAAGEGQRLRPFGVNKPKAMISIVRKPIIHYVIESLAANNIRDIIIIVGYQREQIFDYLGDGSRFGVNIRYVHQDKQLGTAHALTAARELVEDEFLVLAGNKLIMPETIAPIIDTTPPAILIKNVENPARYGVVLFKSGKMIKIVEKPRYPESNYISTGIYAFKKEAFHYLDNELNVPDAINNMLLAGESIEVVETKETWLDIVYPWDILGLNSLILEKLEAEQNGTIEPSVSLRGRVSIGKETNIRSNTYIVGPVVIGSGCEIGPNVCIYPSTSIGNNVTISPFTEIRNSVILDDVEIGSQSAIQDSVIDQGCIIGSHFGACSDNTEIKIENEYHNPVIGAIMGKSCNIGNMVNIQAGCIIGNYCKISPLKQVQGNVPDRSLVI
jgi:UDP-N-acetylglucosamine diphosphorylase / glucose-1-phosphate thymidylyltransferase / UDP-N-acetylgalactosamine diphosphorylase / glucosamine-1-phosphate N-acetyltransferase / galactosamine-1-phosphate N-acetyltransferase